MRQRGISLIEALVAMAVMAVGMLSVLGMQTTLRANSDISKQRSEATRLAQTALEQGRSFSVLATTAGSRAYADINGAASAPVAQLYANAAFEIASAVVDTSPTEVVAARKSTVVSVGWKDRTGTSQQVVMPSIVSRTAPEMAIAIGTPDVGSVVQNPGGRPGVPIRAVDQGNGTSTFVPPGGAGSGVSWVFSNTTGYITKLCVGAACTDVDARLLTGFIRFATGLTQPTYLQSRVPPDPVALAGTGILVNLTAPAVASVPCYGDSTTRPHVIEYFCAVPIGGAGALYWSGRSEVTLAAPAVLAVDSTTDNSSSHYRICRYTPARTNEVGPANIDHPYNYQQVRTYLANQNFLVIRAGNDSGAPFACPDDTLALGRTMTHQPFP